MTKVRATFINFRQKIEGSLAEDDCESMLPGDDQETDTGAFSTN